MLIQITIFVCNSRADYISPLDDLAFDMYQDPEIAAIVRKLEHKKQEYVLAERFDDAKRIRDASTRLQHVGEKLARFEVEKRRAIERDDFEQAQLKKQAMDEYRYQVYRELRLEELLDAVGVRLFSSFLIASRPSFVSRLQHMIAL